VGYKACAERLVGLLNVSPVTLDWPTARRRHRRVAISSDKTIGIVHVIVLTSEDSDDLRRIAFDAATTGSHCESCSTAPLPTDGLVTLSMRSCAVTVFLRTNQAHTTNGAA
jgi:hypothetical protein